MNANNQNRVEAIIGFVFGNHSPNKRPFTLANDDIAYPYKTKETISSTVLLVVALIAPAVIIFFVVIGVEEEIMGIVRWLDWSGVVLCNGLGCHEWHEEPLGPLAPRSFIEM
jgi:hypothetical protein